MKTLTRDEMKNLMGGDAPEGGGGDNPSGKCCQGDVCSRCLTGLTCTTGWTWSAC